MSTSANPARKTWRVRPLIALLALFATYLAVDLVVDFYSAWGYWDRLFFQEGITWWRVAQMVLQLALPIFSVLTSLLVLVSYSGAAPPTGVRRALPLSCAGIVLALFGVRTLLGFWS